MARATPPSLPDVYRQIDLHSKSPPTQEQVMAAILERAKQSHSIGSAVFLEQLIVKADLSRENLLQLLTAFEDGGKTINPVIFTQFREVRDMIHRRLLAPPVPPKEDAPSSDTP